MRADGVSPLPANLSPVLNDVDAFTSRCDLQPKALELSIPNEGILRARLGSVNDAFGYLLASWIGY